jgi:hypothetical protein
MSSKFTSQLKSCTHLRSLNVRHFGMVEATGLSSSMESRPYSMSSPLYIISSKSTSRFKSCSHHSNLNVRHFGMVEATGLSSMESRSYSMSSPHKISSKSTTNRFKSLNVRHFGMVETTGLVWSRGNIQHHYLHTKFHPNPPITSKVRGFFTPTSEV